MPTPRDLRIFVRVKPVERKALDKAAARADMTLSEWLRMVALKAAEAMMENDVPRKRK